MPPPATTWVLTSTKQYREVAPAPSGKNPRSRKARGFFSTGTGCPWGRSGRPQADIGRAVAQFAATDGAVLRGRKPCVQMRIDVTRASCRIKSFWVRTGAGVPATGVRRPRAPDRTRYLACHAFSNKSRSVSRPYTARPRSAPFSFVRGRTVAAARARARPASRPNPPAPVEPRERGSIPRRPVAALRRASHFLNCQCKESLRWTE